MSTIEYIHHGNVTASSFILGDKALHVPILSKEYFETLAIDGIIKLEE
jgi:hypothetical protein